MGGDGHNDDDARFISLQDHNMCGVNGSKEGRWRGMEVGLGGHGIGGYKVLANKGVHEEVQSKIAEYVAGRPK